MAHHWDLVFPHGNEPRLVEMAVRLGFAELLLCYPVTDPLLKERPAEAAALATETINVRVVALATNQVEVGKAQHLKLPIVATPYSGVFEDKRVTYVIGLERGRREDFLHHRNSGLSQVSLRDALRKGKTLLIDAGALLDGKRHPATILGRIMQNAWFARKEPDVPVRVVSGAHEPLRMRAPRDLQDLLRLQ